MRIVPLFVLAVLAAAPVSAHPKLVAASPAANSAVAAPARVQLQFSERLVARFSGADLVMTEMPGMKMSAPMKVQAAGSVAADGKTLVVAPRQRLGSGVYRVDYHVVSSDTHRIQGSYLFRVK